MFTASIPLLDSTGDPAGTGTVQATLDPVGDPFTIEDRLQGSATRRSASQRSFSRSRADGTAVIGGKTFDLDDCFAEDTTITAFRTNPNSFVVRFEFCGHQLHRRRTPTGRPRAVFIDASSPDEVFVDAFLSRAPDRHWAPSVSWR